MKEVFEKKDIEVPGKYVLRDDKVYSIELSDIKHDEIYCSTFTTPTTPVDFGLSLRKRNKENDYDNAIKEIVNFDYFHPLAIKEFIDGKMGHEFKNWWED